MKRILILLVTTFSLLGFSQDIKLNGTVSVENNQIKNVLEPTDGGDVVTKDYLISENNKLKQEIDSLKLKLNDLDGDGIIGDLDLCPFTIPGRPVDENGCQNPIYLDENGVTIKSYDWGRVGDIGKLNGVEYVIVDREMLKSMIINNQDLSKICTTKIIDLRDECNYNGVGSESRFCGLFKNVSSIQDISSWDVSNVTNMSGVFKSSQFNGDISNWDVSNVTNMSGVFESSQFNGDISNWDVSNVTNMSGVFKSSQFNGDISSWDVSNVTNMSGVFKSSQFNGDISNWDVSNVTNMSVMFQGSQFNGDISNWDVSNVTDMSNMFNNSLHNFFPDLYYEVVFNQDLSSWNVLNVTQCNGFSTNTPQWTLPKPNFTNCNPN